MATVALAGDTMTIAVRSRGKLWSLKAGWIAPGAQPAGVIVIVIVVEEEHFMSLVIEVGDPQATKTVAEEAIGGRSR